MIESGGFSSGSVVNAATGTISGGILIASGGFISNGDIVNCGVIFGGIVNSEVIAGGISIASGGQIGGGATATAIVIENTSTFAGGISNAGNISATDIGIAIFGQFPLHRQYRR